MELACSIITRKDKKIPLKLETINKFKNLNISEKIKELSAKQFIGIIESKILN